jgi:hypothetical protein
VGLRASPHPLSPPETDANDGVRGVSRVALRIAPRMRRRDAGRRREEPEGQGNFAAPPPRAGAA